MDLTEQQLIDEIRRLIKIKAELDAKKKRIFEESDQVFSACTKINEDLWNAERALLKKIQSS